MAKESSLGRKDITTERVNKWVNIVDYSSPLELKQLCLTVKSKIIILSHVVLNGCRDSISDNYIIKKGD